MTGYYFGRGGKYEVKLPSSTFAGNRYTIYLRDKKTGEIFKRSAYRTSEKWGYLQDFKFSFKGEIVYLNDILEIGR